MRYSSSFLLLLLHLAGLPAVFTQNLPSAMQFSDDGRMVRTGKATPDGLYDSAVVRTIYLDFPQANYWQLLLNNYASKADIPAGMTVDGVTFDSVGVRFKGQTSYFQTQNSQKKSFNISLDFVHADQRLMGYKTLNLNNSFQDPSFLREVFYQHQIRRHIPAAQSNFVRLNINGQDWGLYPNVQQLNKDFLEEWFLSNDGVNWRADRPDGLPGNPGWGDGTAALNYLGPDTAAYQSYYTLKSSDQDDPWSFLVAACAALNNTPAAELPEVLPNYLDIDRTLWFLASEIAFTDDDSYVYKGKMDYYVYYEPETGRLTPLEYDGNSVLMPMAVTSWGPFYNANKVNYPLLNRILAVPMWRQRYLAHLRTILAEEMDPDVCNVMLENYRQMIGPLVQADPKKLYSYTQFNSEVNNLKNLLASRRNFLLSNPEVSQPAPQILSLDLYNSAGQAWVRPQAGETPYVTSSVSASTGIFRMNLFWATGFAGNFTPVQMFDDGLHHDGQAGDGLYGAELPPQAAGVWVRFYVEAVADNPARTASYFPAGAEHDVMVYQAQPLSSAGPVVINELMASNTTTVTDETGDYDDWIELYNTSDQPVDLSGYFLTDNPANLDKFEIAAGTVVPPYGYLIFWADEDGTDGPFHCNFRLSASGEVLMLLHPDLVIADSVTFGVQEADMGYARVPNGSGPFQIQTPTFNASNDLSGTVAPPQRPGAVRVYPNPAYDRVRVELAAWSEDQFLELFNAGGSLLARFQPEAAVVQIDIGHWPDGLYLLRYGGSAQRLVVQH